MSGNPLVPCRNDGALVFFCDEFLHCVRLVGLYEFLVSRLILVLFTDSDDHDCQRGVLVFQEDTLFVRREACAHDVVHGDDGSIYIVKASWKLGSFDFLELDVLRVFYYVSRGGFHAYALFQLDNACLFKELETAAFVGGIVRNGNGSTFGKVFHVFHLIGVDAHAHEDGPADIGEMGAVLFVEVFHEGFMLVYDNIQIPVCQCLVRGNVVREFLYIDLKAVLFSFLGGSFYYFRMGAGSSAYGDFFLFCRSRGSGRGCGLLAGTAAGDKCCCGECARPAIANFLNMSKTSFLF